MVSENGDGPKLRLFLDCADIEHWPEWLGTGLITGVTTNPQLLAASYSEGYEDLLPRLASKAPESSAEEIHSQTWGRASTALLARGRKIAKLGEGVVVKIPITRAGIEAASQLRRDGARVTMTTLYASHQVVSASAIRAEYAAPYFGRMNDAHIDEMAEIT